MLDDLVGLLHALKEGGVGRHVRAMMRCADHRGSDVVLHEGVLDRQLRQRVPYPLFALEWRAVSHYRWRAPSHINVLEVQALLDYVSWGAASGALRGCRYLHVLDSAVATAVVSKGRSSALALNRPLRRLAAFLLAADIYPFAVWTVSGWNVADRPSRWGRATEHHPK